MKLLNSCACVLFGVSLATPNLAIGIGALGLSLALPFIALLLRRRQ